MEAYNGPRWRHSHPGGHRARGNAHGAFNNHLQRQNHIHPMERNNWGMNSMNGGQAELWNGGGDHWPDHAPVYHHDMQHGKPMENRYGNNRWTNGNPQQYLMNQPRMEFHPNPRMGWMRPNTWRGGRGRGFNESIRGPHFHPRSHRGNVYFPTQTMPGPHAPKITLLDTPSSITSVDTPRSFFPSPSTDSENLPRDPRQRSAQRGVTSPHCNKYQDGNHVTDCHTTSFPDIRQNGVHSPMDGELYQSFSHRVNNMANYPPHGRRDHGHGFFKDRGNHTEQQFNMPPHRIPVIEDGNTKSNVPCPVNITSEQFLIEHSYCSLQCADKTAHHDGPCNEVFNGNLSHGMLTQCTSIDIPLPAHYNSIESDGCHSTILDTTHDEYQQTPDENIAKEITSKDSRQLLPLSEQTPSSNDSPLEAMLHSSANNTEAIASDQVETIDLELESSPFSLNGFDMDLDSEIDSIASSSPSQASSDGDDDVIFIMSSAAPLNVSIPINKVSLSTKLLLKHSLITKDPAVLLPTVIKDITPQNGQLIEEASSVSGERSEKQQSDTMQLRNRVLPRNLFLFASRKGPPRIKEEDVDVVTLDSSFNSTPPRDGMTSTTVTDERRHESDDGEMDWRSESSYEIENTLNDRSTSVAVKRSFSPSSYAPPAKMYKKSPSPAASSNKRKFQDFVPVVLKSRSRAENRTILRRQLMEMEMQKNEKERIDTLIPGEESNSSEEGIHYLTRKKRSCLRRDKYSPLNSHDDANSIGSGSISSKEPESIQSSSSKDFPPELVKYYNRVLSHSKNKSGSGDTPLHCLCRTGKYDVVSYVLTKELYNINVQDNAGWTPLHEACSKGHRDIVELLLQHGADPNLPATDGTRPIHDAVEAGNFEIVTVLVKHGADPMVEYSERTPLEIAKSAHFEDIASYLSEVCETRKAAKQPDKIKPDVAPQKATASKPLNTTILYDGEIKLPINGYSEPFLGSELDQPVFYVSATIEMSMEPMLPVYNLTVSLGSNPRKHNFHILEDVLKQLNTNREDILPRIAVNTYTITAGEFMDQLKNNSLTKNAKILHKLDTIDRSCQLEMIPACDDLRRLLSIEVENIDD